MNSPRALIVSLLAAAAFSSQPASAQNETQKFDPTHMLGVLSAEMALQYGDPATAAETYYVLAKRSRDPKVTERAVELLLRNRRMNDAREIVALWQQVDSEAARPAQIALALALSNQDEAAARNEVLRAITLPEAVRAQAIMDMARQLTQYPNRDVAVKLAGLFVERLPALPESYYALAVASTGTENQRLGEAMLAIDRALNLRPGWPQAIAVKARLLQIRAVTSKRSDDSKEAVKLLESAIAASPDAPEQHELRQLLARIYLDLGEPAKARGEFLKLVDDGKPDVEDMQLSATLAAYQARDWETAEREFLEALDAGRGEPSAVLFYLGRIAEFQKKWVLAAERFGQVAPGPNFWEAQIRIAGALAQEKKVLQAMSHLRGLKPASDFERVSLAQAEALIWRESGELQKSLEALDRAIAADKENTDLIYEAAMVEERLLRFEASELRLRQVMKLEPERAHAFNALGYSLADRNIRLDEARELIEKAHQLEPEDPAILDSMGWVAFRQGRMKDAEDYLRRALTVYKDGEVAAHLGEVLWAQGQKEEARKVWQAQLELQPDHEVLKKTMLRFAP